MKIEKVKVSQIAVNLANPRTITDADFRKLVNSILVLPKMLNLRPIVVDSTFTALGGNMRSKALNYIAEMTEEALVEELEACNGFKKKNQEEQDALKAYWLKWHDNPVCPVVKADELTDAEKQEFIIKDNSSFGKWDFDALANEWDAEDLADWGVDVWQGNSSLDMDSFFDAEDPKEKDSDLSIKITVPEGQKENEDEIRTFLEQLKVKFPGVDIK